METREGTALGGFVTFAVYPLSIVFILMLFDEVKRAPPAQTREILWTSQEAGPRRPLYKYQPVPARLND